MAILEPTPEIWIIKIFALNSLVIVWFTVREIEKRWISFKAAETCSIVVISNNDFDAIRITRLNLWPNFKSRKYQIKELTKMKIPKVCKKSEKLPT